VTAPEPIGLGSLKLVIGCGIDATLADRIGTEIAPHVRADDVRRAGDAIIVYTDAEPGQIRDWLAPALRDGESVLVVEFERWSSRGDAVDRTWLLRRGH